ncbi:hypothetical protein TIFTF001_007599 [Ficus carica]|uniref:Uncharacterized protein n=1 Tax=Ficus carica TaxID=3494 RepID=A0AA88A3A3_FICCA|nr:hypothetical protein TIFTF001_007599 [Ficus carica]
MGVELSDHDTPYRIALTRIGLIRPPRGKEDKTSLGDRLDLTNLEQGREDQLRSGSQTIGPRALRHSVSDCTDQDRLDQSREEKTNSRMGVELSYQEIQAD